MKILVSSCLLGHRVRYDGKDKRVDGMEILSRYHELIAFCPEVTGGLSVPREPAEIVGNSLDIIKKGEGKVVTISGEDVTEAFLEGAGKALALCKEKDIKVAILKEKSPSCGSNFIYDGSHNNIKVKGAGITGELLKLNGISVYTEDNFHLLFPEECEYTFNNDENI